MKKVFGVLAAGLVLGTVGCGAIGGLSDLSNSAAGITHNAARIKNDERYLSKDKDEAILTKGNITYVYDKTNRRIKNRLDYNKDCDCLKQNETYNRDYYKENEVFVSARDKSDEGR